MLEIICTVPAGPFKNAIFVRTTPREMNIPPIKPKINSPHYNPIFTRFGTRRIKITRRLLANMALKVILFCEKPILKETRCLICIETEVSANEAKTTRVMGNYEGNSKTLTS